MFWTRKRIRRLIDIDRVQRAIEAGERRTSGEIRVSIAPWFWGDVERAASQAFVRLGMHRTQARNGVLIFLVPSRRTFAIRGDEGIHACVGQAFWDELSSRMSRYFQRGEFTEGLVSVIEATAEQLAQHFPHAGDRDENELPDEIDLG